MIISPTIYQEDCIKTIWHLEKLGASFNILNAIKYLWRLGNKTADYRDDLEKVIVYISWEVAAIRENIEELKICLDNPAIFESTEKEVTRAVALSKDAADVYGEIIAQCNLLIDVYEKQEN